MEARVHCVSGEWPSSGGGGWCLGRALSSLSEDLGSVPDSAGHLTCHLCPLFYLL